MEGRRRGCYFHGGRMRSPHVSTTVSVDQEDDDTTEEGEEVDGVAEGVVSVAVATGVVVVAVVVPDLAV
jgi:hypothetical protein